MVARIQTAAPFGVEAILVEVEVHLRSGLPGYSVVGLPQAAVRESRDRVLAALRNSDLPIPRGAITVNLAPADVRKDGTLFDLPLAIGLLGVQEELEGDWDGVMLAGELALDGRVRPGRGILALARAAKAAGYRRIVVPAPNAREAALVSGLDVVGVTSLGDAVEALRDPDNSRPLPPEVRDHSTMPPPDLRDVRGQPLARRALEIAAAGGHNLLLVGPPGVGKSMLARRLPSLLPDLSEEQALEAMQIQSVSGRLDHVDRLNCTPPFEAPHHSVSTAGLIGGGNPPRPGALSLAHRGILFLDELPEFSRRALEALREPLETGWVRLSRARYQVRFPSACRLVAAMNPCPCGYAGHPIRPCTCDPSSVARYTARISGPLLDRIDLHVPVGPVDPRQLLGGVAAESSEEVRRRVLDALRIQPEPGLDDASRRLLARAMDRYGASARAVRRLQSVAATIARLDGRARIRDADIAEALQFHRPRYRRAA